jgi:hypothetical protein
VSLLALTSVEGYHGYLLFAWMYGGFLGGLNFSLATFVLERSRIRHFARDWGFLQGARALPLLLGIPVVGYVNLGVGSAKSGHYFSLGCSLIGAVSLFAVDCFGRKDR